MKHHNNNAMLYQCVCENSMRKTTMLWNHHHHNDNNHHHLHGQVPIWVMQHSPRQNHNRVMPTRTNHDAEIDNTDLCYLKAMKTTIVEIGLASTSSM